MDTPIARKTIYNNHVYASILEAKIAAFLTALGVNFAPEGETVKGTKGFTLLPDFLIEDARIITPALKEIESSKLFIEAKGEDFVSKENTVNKLLNISNKTPLFVMTGLPQFTTKGKEKILSCPTDKKSDPKGLSFNFNTICGVEADAMIGIGKDGKLVICPVETSKQYIDTKRTAECIRKAITADLTVSDSDTTSDASLPEPQPSATPTPFDGIKPVEFIPAYRAFEITAPQALYIVNNYFYEFQRDLNRPHVEELHYEMANGGFDRCTLTFCHTEDEGKFRLIDGQHRMVAMTSFLKSLPNQPARPDLTFVFDVVVREVPNMEAVRPEYDSFQAKELARQEVLSVRDQNISKEEQKVVDAVYRATPIAENFLKTVCKRDPLRFSIQRKKEVFENRWRLLGEKYFKIIEGADAYVGKALKAKKIIAFGMILLEAHPEKAEDFLGQLSKHKTSKRQCCEDANRMLINYKDDKSRLAICISSWNSFFEKKYTKKPSFNYDFEANGICGVVKKKYVQGSLIEVV